MVFITHNLKSQKSNPTLEHPHINLTNLSKKNLILYMLLVNSQYPINVFDDSSSRFSELYLG